MHTQGSPMQIRRARKHALSYYNAPNLFWLWKARTTGCYCTHMYTRLPHPECTPLARQHTRHYMHPPYYNWLVKTMWITVNRCLL